MDLMVHMHESPFPFPYHLSAYHSPAGDISHHGWLFSNLFLLLEEQVQLRADQM